MSDSFMIRPLTTADEALVWEMLYHAIHVPEGAEAPPRAIVFEPGLAHYAQDWGQRAGDLGFAALEAGPGRAVGAAWLRLPPADDPGYGWVDEHTPELSVALLPGYRGQGLGSRLIAALLEEARGRFGAVSLSVQADNAAKGLYERLGFKTVKEDGTNLVLLKPMLQSKR
jgi:ribosomal protein S18 acetylase RimI-like enzyme